MLCLLHQLIETVAEREPDAAAVVCKGETLSYGGAWRRVGALARSFAGLGLEPGDRIGIYLEKRFETVVAIFAASLAGAVFVPINPQLRARQVSHILRDCNARLLVTSREKHAALSEQLASAAELRHVILADEGDAEPLAGIEVLPWPEVAEGTASGGGLPGGTIDRDMAAILYTSGSTGLPKGVVLSHRNLVSGAATVSGYLEHRPSDRILAVLPLSFDAGLSQLTTAFHAGATAVLLNYLLPRGVPTLCAEERITGLTCVAPLWSQLAQQDWPEEAARHLRYFANTGGHLPAAVLGRLRERLPKAKPYLMYGLTEAFRSTYLDPSEVDRRPGSIGKAIPNEQILVVDAKGRPCAAGEEGELVHRGSLVALGYWNNPEGTAERFRPAPGQPDGLVLPEIAVWSGDIVKTDAEGFLYFVGRRDDMIKTSGYRVSPAEIEELIHESGLAGEAAAVGVPHAMLGQAILLVCSPRPGEALDRDALMQLCRRNLPNYMVPVGIEERPSLPLSPNGKIDRRLLAEEFGPRYAETPS